MTPIQRARPRREQRAERHDRSPWNWLLLRPAGGDALPADLQQHRPEPAGLAVLLLVPDGRHHPQRPRDPGRLPEDEALTCSTTSTGSSCTVFIVLFVVVSGMGFVAARWRRADDLEHLDEWGLGGRNFGPWVTWFLLGGDLYTAYTFVAVPALVFGAGRDRLLRDALHDRGLPDGVPRADPAVVGRRTYTASSTPADFVRARHGSSTLALLVAITGIVATMPYIALQLVGIEAVLKAMGVTGHVPIIVAFAILAAYTYNSGLRAPALIAFVKDALIYLVIIVAVIVIPYKLGGWDASSAPPRRSSPRRRTPGTA